MTAKQEGDKMSKTFLCNACHQRGTPQHFNDSVISPHPSTITAHCTLAKRDGAYYLGIARVVCMSPSENGECEMYEEGEISEKMTKVDECDTEKFRALDSIENTIATLGDRWWPRMAKQKGGKR